MINAKATFNRYCQAKNVVVQGNADVKFFKRIVAFS